MHDFSRSCEQDRPAAGATGESAVIQLKPTQLGPRCQNWLVHAVVRQDVEEWLKKHSEPLGEGEVVALVSGSKGVWGALDLYCRGGRDGLVCICFHESPEPRPHKPVLFLEGCAGAFQVNLQQ